MKERKPYTTKNRSEILDYLKKNCSSTISAADIKKHLEEKEISVNTTTIYRFLDKLCAENIIIKYSDVNSDKAVYQYAGEQGNCREHLHLKCIKCGKCAKACQMIVDPVENSNSPECIRCGRCRKACPTNAIQCGIRRKSQS